MSLKERYKTRKGLLIAALVVLIISMVSFGISIIIHSKTANAIPLDFNQLIASGNDKKDQCVQIDVYDISDSIAYETVNGVVTKEWYVAYNTNNNGFLVQLSKETFDEMVSNIKADSAGTYTYRLRGYTVDIDKELKGFTIEALDQWYDDNPVSMSNFEEYFGFTYLDEVYTPTLDKENTFKSISLFMFVLYAVLFVSFIIKLVRNKKTRDYIDAHNIDDVIRNESTIALNNLNLYITNDSIISANNKLQIIPIEEIALIYSINRKHNGVSTGLYLTAFSSIKKNKQYELTRTFDESALYQFYNSIAERFPEVMIGYTKENLEAYKALFKKK